MHHRIQDPTVRVQHGPCLRTAAGVSRVHVDGVTIAVFWAPRWRDPKAAAETHPRAIRRRGYVTGAPVLRPLTGAVLRARGGAA